MNNQNLQSEISAQLREILALKGNQAVAGSTIPLQQQNQVKSATIPAADPNSGQAGQATLSFSFTPKSANTLVDYSMVVSVDGNSSRSGANNVYTFGYLTASPFFWPTFSRNSTTGQINLNLTFVNMSQNSHAISANITFFAKG